MRVATVRQEDEQLVEEAGDDGLEPGNGHLRVRRGSGRARDAAMTPSLARTDTYTPAMTPPDRRPAAPRPDRARRSTPGPVTLDGRIVRLAPLR